MEKEQLGRASDGLYACIIREYGTAIAERLLKDLDALGVAVASALGRSLRHADYDVWLTGAAAAAELEHALADAKGLDLWTEEGLRAELLVRAVVLILGEPFGVATEQLVDAAAAWAEDLQDAQTPREAALSLLELAGVGLAQRSRAPVDLDRLMSYTLPMIEQLLLRSDRSKQDIATDLDMLCSNIKDSCNDLVDMCLPPQVRGGLR
jgi:hypothetical protein